MVYSFIILETILIVIVYLLVRSSPARALGLTGPAITHARLAPNNSRRTPATHSTLKMQSLPDARSQSFEELYGPPENFLEIEVRPAAVHPVFPR